MLGLIFIYFIGKYFYDLAEEYGKHNWLYAIAGIVCYYAGSFIFGVILGVGIEIWSPGFLNEMNNKALGYIAIPFGVLTCVGMYYLLKRHWSKGREGHADILDDIDL
ncbi:MAG: hypothetical protein KDC61_11175 [Saprospiraceae bacterium]|nr:hypothetical protein [Saprospiraceae bacterium]MCB0575112.1 hypothetical protein [Saprospiraceae bacterium]MCB9305092.1 hypothetical protein [Lewinellaceae bacterium]MCB9353371.1 hypothetical protein [Lewinellaceae bacterium]